MGNHSVCTMTDGESFEKVFIFGGITYSKLAPMMTLAEKREKDKLRAKRNRHRGLESKKITNELSEFSHELVVEENESPTLRGIQESSHLSNDLYCIEVRQIL